MADFPDAWTKVLEDMGIEAKSVSPPSEASGDWFELYSSFATRGFVRGLVSAVDDGASLRVQCAIPTGDHEDTSIVKRLCTAFVEAVGGDWRIVGQDPDWELAGEFSEAPGGAAFGSWLGRLEDLASVAKSGDIEEVDWLLDADEASSRTSGSGAEETASETSETSDAESTGGTRTSSSGSGLFEAIGDETANDSTPSSALRDARIESFEVHAGESSVEARARIGVSLASSDRELLGRSLAHALRARYDVAARSLPADVSEPGASDEIRLEIEPTEAGISGSLSNDEIRDDVASYFERLVRFDDLGVKLADFLGIGGEDGGPSARVDRQRDDENRDRGRDREGPRQGRSRRRDRSRPEERSDRAGRTGEPPEEAVAEPDESATVLDLGGGSGGGHDGGSSRGAGGTGPLEPGNYRDPRLLREDADTSLVDVALRHPGYAEQKMGHNLSILLSIDFPDAMELVERAPCVIAWGVGRERGLRFKRVIEDAGGTVVLVEPGSLPSD